MYCQDIKLFQFSSFFNAKLTETSEETNINVDSPSSSSDFRSNFFDDGFDSNTPTIIEHSNTGEWTMYDRFKQTMQHSSSFLTDKNKNKFVFLKDVLSKNKENDFVDNYFVDWWREIKRDFYKIKPVTLSKLVRSLGIINFRTNGELRSNRLLTERDLLMIENTFLSYEAKDIDLR